MKKICPRNFKVNFRWELGIIDGGVIEDIHFKRLEVFLLNGNYFSITTQRPPSVVISHFPSRGLDRTSSLTLSAVTLILPIGGVCFPNPPPTKAIPAVLSVL